MSYKKIVFYNGHQHGDIANSRGIVDYIVNHLDNNFQFYYLHDKHPESILFGSRVEIFNSISNHGKVFPYWNNNQNIIKETHKSQLHYTYNDMVFLNLWIGSSPYYITDSGQKGIAITRKRLAVQAIECISFINYHCQTNIPYPNLTTDTIPKTLQAPKNQTIINQFIYNTFPKYRKKILIPNGPVESGQTPQFNFHEKLWNFMERNRDILFLYTDTFAGEDTIDNCYCINNICKIPNLNEIEYISIFCDVLLTRCSGAGCIILNKNNYYNKSKSIISFTSNPGIAFEALSSDTEIRNQKWGSDQTAKMIWSNNFAEENIQNIIHLEITS